MKLILFDVDGTLLKTSKAHVDSFEVAFKKVCDVNGTGGGYDGYTSPQIIYDVLERNGFSKDKIKEKYDEIVKVLIETAKEKISKEKLIILPGVEELLKELSEKDILMGLVTGNMEEIARFKFKKLGLTDYFKVGGFGSDDFSRTNLVKIAIKRAENLRFKGNDVFLVGDTPRDVKAGKGAGVKVIAVATGSYSKEDLKDAVFVLDTLKNKDKFLEIINQQNGN